MGYRRALSVVVPILVLAFVVAAGADDDHARAKAARDAGAVVPLRAILDRVEAEFTGSPVEIELDDDNGRRWLYKVKVIAPTGSILKLEYDARNAQLIRAKGSGVDAARRQRPN